MSVAVVFNKKYKVDRSELSRVKDKFKFIGVKLSRSGINTITSYNLNGVPITYQYQYLSDNKPCSPKLNELFDGFRYTPVKRKKYRSLELHILLDDFSYPSSDSEILVYDISFNGSVLNWGYVCELIYYECKNIENMTFLGLEGFYYSGNIIYSKICSVF